MLKLIQAVLVTLLVGSIAQAEGGGHGGGHQSKSGANLNLLPPPQADKALATPPGKVTLQTPAPFEKVVGGGVQLKWTESAGAESYHLQVATDPNFKWLMVNENFVKGTTFEVKGLEAGKQYFWRVAGRKVANIPGSTQGDFSMSSFEAR